MASNWDYGGGGGSPPNIRLTMNSLGQVVAERIVDVSEQKPKKKGRVLNVYSLEDFRGCLSRLPTGVSREMIEKVTGAHGQGAAGGGSWQGGFVLKMVSGMYGYLSGHCDSGGWQNGYAEANFQTANHPIDFDLPEHLDEEPTNINAWIENPESSSEEDDYDEIPF